MNQRNKVYLFNNNISTNKYISLHHDSLKRLPVQKGSTEEELMEPGNWLAPKPLFHNAKLGNEKLLFTACRLKNVFGSTSHPAVNSNSNGNEMGGTKKIA